MNNGHGIDFFVQNPEFFTTFVAYNLPSDIFIMYLIYKFFKYKIVSVRCDKARKNIFISIEIFITAILHTIILIVFKLDYIANFLTKTDTINYIWINFLLILIIGFVVIYLSSKIICRNIER